MQNIKYREFEIINPTNINVIIGRNGSGKSRFLRSLAQLASDPQYFIQYVSPERAGSFLADMHIGNTLLHDKNWEFSTKHKNQVESFKKFPQPSFVSLVLGLGIKFNMTWL